MEDIYNQVGSFFANDIDVNDLFDSEAIIWIDWREYDEDVVNYFNDMMAEPIDIQPLVMASPMVTILCYEKVIKSCKFLTVMSKIGM